MSNVTYVAEPYKILIQKIVRRTYYIKNKT